MSTYVMDSETRLVFCITPQTMYSRISYVARGTFRPGHEPSRLESLELALENDEPRPRYFRVCVVLPLRNLSNSIQETGPGTILSAVLALHSHAKREQERFILDYSLHILLCDSCLCFVHISKDMMFNLMPRV